MTDREKEGSCKLSSCVINIAKMQFDREQIGVLADFDFITWVGIAYHLGSRRLKKTFKNWCPRRPKTIPKRSLISVACWKRFHNSFATVFDSQMASQKRSLRRPRGLQKRLLFSLASQEASRMDFGAYLDPLGLGFKQFFKVILAWQIGSEVCLSLQFCIAFRRAPNALNFHIGIHSRQFSCRLWNPWPKVPKGRLLFFPLQVRALSVTVNSFYM